MLNFPHSHFKLSEFYTSETIQLFINYILRLVIPLFYICVSLRFIRMFEFDLEVMYQENSDEEVE